MKKKLLFISLVLTSMMLVNHSAKAQFNPISDAGLMATVGVGFSSWGVPIFARVEKGVGEYFSAGGQLSYQSRSTTYWSHSIIGISARGSYHFNELISASNEVDIYAGLNLGYYIWNTKARDNFFGGVYTGNSGGFSIGLQVGGRYFINDNLAINAEFGGGNVISGGTIGLTFLL